MSPTGYQPRPREAYPPAVLLFGTSELALARLHSVVLLHELHHSEPMANAVQVAGDPDLVTQALRQWRQELNPEDLHEVRGALLNSAQPDARELSRALLRLEDVDRLLEQLESRWVVRILAERSVFMDFQPLVSVRERRTVAYECLLRGRQDGAEVSAGRMLGAARALGLMHQLDRAVWERAITQGGDLTRRGHLLFVNFTPSSFAHPKMVLEDILKFCQAREVDARQVVFEITEGEKLGNVEQMKEIIRLYRREGVKVAVDDLGSGYSSILHLAELQPDYVKLDQELVRGAYRDYVRSVLLRGVADAAHELGIAVVAEGVETEEDLKFCIALDADLVQGYFLARPAETPPAVTGDSVQVLEEWVRDTGKEK